MPPSKKAPPAPTKRTKLHTGQKPQPEPGPGASNVSEARPQPSQVGDVRSMGIYARMLWIMERLPYMQKTGEMTEGKRYKFVEEPELMAAARPLFITAGVYMFLDELSCEQLTRQTRNGPVDDLTRKSIAYTFVNVDNPADRFVSRVNVLAYDNLDKGPGKATTAAGKLAVLKALMMPTGDDELETPNAAPDTEPEKPQEGQRQARQPQAQRQPTRTPEQPRTERKAAPAAETPAATEPSEEEKLARALRKPVSLETLAKARELAGNILLPPSSRKEALAYLDEPHSEGKVRQVIERLEAAINGAGEEDEPEPGEPSA